MVGVMIVVIEEVVLEVEEEPGKEVVEEMDEDQKDKVKDLEGPPTNQWLPPPKTSLSLPAPPLSLEHCATLVVLVHCSGNTSTVNCFAVGKSATNFKRLCATLPKSFCALLSIFNPPSDRQSNCDDDYTLSSSYQSLSHWMKTIQGESLCISLSDKCICLSLSLSTGYNQHKCFYIIGPTLLSYRDPNMFEAGGLW